MKILATNASRKGHKFIGAHVPIDLYYDISLYVLAKKTTKAKFLQVLLDDWRETATTPKNINSYIEAICVKSTARWGELRRKNPLLTVKEFKENLYEELSSRGIKEEHATQIISKLKI